MSRRKVKARNRVALKNTRDGLVEHNTATGEETVISKREADFDLRGEPTEQETFSQVGKSPETQKPQTPDQPNATKRKQTYRHSKTESSPDTKTDAATSEQSDISQSTDAPLDNTPADTAKPTPSSDGGREPSESPTTTKSKPERQKQYAEHQPGKTESTDAPATDTPADTPVNERNQYEPVADTAEETQPDSAAATKLQEDRPDSKLNTEPDSRLQFTETQDVPPSTIKPKPKPKGKETSAQEAYAPKPDKSGKLQFTPDEAAPETAMPANSRKLSKAQAQAERASSKLDKARDNLPSKRKLQKTSVVDEKSGSVRNKLQFEKTPISQGEHIRGSRVFSPVKTAGNTLILNAHRRIYQVEHENVGVKAAHRAEMAGEVGVRTALRFHKTAPYRKVAKLERAARKKSVNLTYQQTLAKNPKLKSNVLTRAMQKRKIKKDYAKAAREAQKAAKRAKQAGKTSARVAKALVGFVKRHPIFAGIVILVSLLLYTVMSLIGALGGAGSGGFGAIVASTYLAEDADMYAAQEAYAAMEADLQYQLDNYELLNPGYDEYIYELDTIWHDPYVLMSILGALHDGAWTADGVQATLEMLFDMQYTLTETATTETRYRTETVTLTDPLTGDEYEDSEDVAYDYSIITVTLENFNLSHLPIYIMGEERLSRYALFTATLGNRPDLFPVSAYPHASYYMEYLRYDVPEAYLADETFAAMITEANKYLGMPYVWGGYNPRTSFDCSGYVSWVLNNSGWDIGRLGAQGLYNYSTPVSAADARPGDLVFFHSTYRADSPVTHVGIYVGDGMMVHAGNPIGYASIETTYWQNHFYAFGRVY